MKKKFRSLNTFYLHYLNEHKNPVCKILHFIGTALFLNTSIYAILAGPIWILALGPFAGYTFAWIGHFVFERNQPATFSHPLYSLISDFLMFWHWITFQLPQKTKEARLMSIS